MSYETWKAYHSESAISAPWPAPREEVLDGARVPPVYGEILISAAQSAFPTEWIWEKRMYPVRVAGESGASLVSSSVLVRSMAVALRNGAGGITLVRFDRSAVQFTASTAIASTHGDAPPGIYAMLPLELDSAIDASPRSSDSVDQLFALARDLSSTIVSLEVLVRYVRFPRR
jgi:hypothetical protein